MKYKPNNARTLPHYVIRFDTGRNYFFVGFYQGERLDPHVSQNIFKKIFYFGKNGQFWQKKRE